MCHGRIDYPNGSYYVGEWRDDKFHGRGLFHKSGGERYIGFWRENMRHGKGVQVLPDGSKFDGEFRNDFRAGWGTLTESGGRSYVGEWQSDERHGEGVEFDSAGFIIRSGIWQRNSLLSTRQLDAVRFSLNSPSNSEGADLASISDKTKTERDRLAAEVEAERKKRQELEAQLAEAKERERQQAQAPQPQRPQVALRNERRLALVIGNSSYKISPLDNPANDANDVAESLKKFGFQTTLVRNATLGQMREATRKFADQLPSADVALIYFAGHGIESNRKNYMILSLIHI